MKHSSFAPVLRESDQEIVGQVFAGAQCWSPVRPSRMMFVDRFGTQGGGIPCRKCPGCCQLGRLRLNRRLAEKYRDHPGAVHCVHFALPHSEHGEFAHACRRWKGWRFEPGFYRTGLHELTLIAVEDPRKWRAPRPRRWAHVTWEFSHVHPKQRARAFRALTRGMLTPRIFWGENVNRFHHIGLPALERTEKWTVSTRAGLRQAFGASREARAHRLGRSILKPRQFTYPKMISRREGRFAANSEVAAMVKAVTDRFDRMAAALKSPRPAPQATIRALRSRSDYEVGGAGYSSSVHSSVESRASPVQKSTLARASPASTRSDGLIERFFERAGVPMPPKLKK